MELVKHLINQPGFLVSVFGRSANPDIQAARLAQYPVDVTNQDHLLECMDKAVECYGKLASVVFLQRNRGSGEFQMELTVALNATKTTIDYIVDRQLFSEDCRSNSVVLVSSVADRNVAPEQSLGYHIGKAGISQLARYYALKLGPIGIRVNTVSPCVVAKERAKEFYDQNEWLVERFRKYIPLGRMGNPEDIVNAIMFLISEQASYITGQNIVVDGGLTLRTQESLIRDFPRGD